MDLKYICRICLINIKLEPVKLSEQLYTFLETDLRLNDVPRSHSQLAIPKYICFSCYKCMVKFRNFYKKCLDAEKFFKIKLAAIHEGHPDPAISQSPLQQDDNEDDDDNDYCYDNDNIQEKAIDINSLQHISCVEILQKNYNELAVVENDDDWQQQPENSNSILIKSVNESYNFDENSHESVAIAKPAEIEIIEKSTTANTEPANSSNSKRSRLFVCSVCDMDCFTKADLRLHEGIHPGLRPFQCEVCDFAFKQRSQLNTHLTLHYGKKIKCPQCDKRFPRKSGLIRHARVHNGERPFQCYQCGKTFLTAYGLRCHEDQEHNGKLQFSCQFCEKQFYSRFKLVEHKNKDHIRYYCKSCDKNYKMRESIYKHLKKDHKIKEVSEDDFIVKIG